MDSVPQNSWLSQHLWKRAMAILSGFGLLWAGVKTFREIEAALNGWYVLLILSFLCLIIVGIGTFLDWLKAQFKKQEALTTELKKAVKEIDGDLRGQVSELNRKMRIGV